MATQTRKLAFIGNYAPRSCSLGAFSAALLSHLTQKSGLEAFAVAVSDRCNHYRYPGEVRFVLEQKELPSYIRAAEFINLAQTDLVWLQYDRLMYGGRSGSHILSLLRELKAPVVTTLHTVTADLPPRERSVINEILRLSSRIVATSSEDKELLIRTLSVPPERVDLIPHGTPQGSGRDSALWPLTAQLYLKAFREARRGKKMMSRKGRHTRPRRPGLPPIRFGHLSSMTDSTGVFQHAKYTVPNFGEGYCTDDNARALIFAVLAGELGLDCAQVGRIAKTSLAFLNHALNRQTGRFRNFMSFTREWLEEQGSEDSHGRALWALGTAIGHSRFEGIRMLAGQLMEGGLETAEHFSSPRAWAFTLLGINEYLGRLGGDRKAAAVCASLAERLLDLYRTGAGDDWPWFEPVCTYDNAKLPHALIVYGSRRNSREALKCGLEALGWLVRVQSADEGYFRPIGCNGWYPRGGECAFFDQQPLEAHSVASACIEAFRVTGERCWMEKAAMAFEWFLGRNELGVEVCDTESGGCRDALHAERLNENQGAESTLAYLLCLAEMHRIMRAAPER
ncbi:MAG: glycosyltransferase [Fibrobacterota bacterium]